MKFSEIIARVCPGVFTHSGPTSAGHDRQKPAKSGRCQAASIVQKRSLNWAFRASGKLSGRVLDHVIPPRMTGMRVGAIALDRRYDKSIDTSDIRMPASHS